jgi:uncharacterized membrane protein YgcG
MFRKIVLLFVLCLCSATTWATCPVGTTVASIKASDQPYSSLPAVQGVTINSEVEIRNAALTAIAGAYRISHGLKTLPVGAQFQVTYTDGSSECGMVDSTTSSLGAVPEAGTQQAAGSGGGGAAGGGNTGGGAGSGGGGGGGGYIFTCYLVDPDTGAKTQVPCNNDP